MKEDACNREQELLPCCTKSWTSFSDPGPAVDVLVNQHPDYKKFKKMPQNLLDAMRAMKKDSYMVQALGPDLVHGFTSLKEREWDQFMSNITDWERTYYLNC